MNFSLKRGCYGTKTFFWKKMDLESGSTNPTGEFFKEAYLPSLDGCNNLGRD